MDFFFQELTNKLCLVDQEEEEWLMKSKVLPRRRASPATFSGGGGEKHGPINTIIIIEAEPIIFFLGWFTR